MPNKLYNVFKKGAVVLTVGYPFTVNATAPFFFLYFTVLHAL